MRGLRRVRTFLILIGMLPHAGCEVRRDRIPGGVHDFGPVFAASEPFFSHEIRVTNTTDRTIQILGETHSCTCMKVELDRVELEPGGSVPLLVKVDVAPVLADRVAHCTIETDHPEHPFWRYEFRYRSYPPGRVVPERIVIGPSDETLGSREASEAVSGRSARASLEVFATRSEHLPSFEQIVPYSPAELRVRFDHSPRLDRFGDGMFRATYDVVVSLDEKAPTPGLSTRLLTFKAGDEILAESYVEWENRLPIEAEPPSLHFGLLDRAAEPKALRVEIRSVEGVPFRVLSVTSTSPHVGVADGGDGGRSASVNHSLEVTFDPKDAAGANGVTGHLRIETDLSESGFSIPWSAFLRTADRAVTRAADQP